MTSNTSGFTPSRRTLVKGAAWSVPVVAVAGAAPAFAASLPFQIIWGSACKLPGNSGYVKHGYRFMNVCFVNTQATTYTVDFTGFTVNGIPAKAWWPEGVTIGPDSSVCITIDAGPYDNSANGQACLSVDWSNTRGESGEGTSCTYVNDLPPCECRGDDCEEPTDETTTADEVQAEEPATEDLTVEEPTTVETQSVEQPAEVTETDAPGDDASQTAQPQG